MFDTISGKLGDTGVVPTGRESLGAFDKVTVVDYIPIGILKLLTFTVPNHSMNKNSHRRSRPAPFRSLPTAINDVPCCALIVGTAYYRLQ